MRAAILLVAALLMPLACVTEEIEDDSQEQPIDECADHCASFGDCVYAADRCSFKCVAESEIDCRASRLCAESGRCCLGVDGYDGCGICEKC